MNYKMIIDLRHMPHACPEISGQEEKTKFILIEFLKKHTLMEIHHCGNGFYVAHQENSLTNSPIAL